MSTQKTRELSTDDIHTLKEIQRCYELLDVMQANDTYESEMLVRIHATLVYGLPDEIARVLWAAGVRSRGEFESAAKCYRQIGPSSRGSSFGPASRFIRHFVLENLEVLKPDEEYEGQTRKNPAALLDRLENLLKSGFSQVCGDVEARCLEEFDGKVRFQFLESSDQSDAKPTTEKTYTRAELSQGKGAIGQAFEFLNSLIDIVRSDSLC